MARGNDMEVSIFLQNQIKAGQRRAGYEKNYRAGQDAGYQNSSRAAYRLQKYLNLQSSIRICGSLLDMPLFIRLDTVLKVLRTEDIQFLRTVKLQTKASKLKNHVFLTLLYDVLLRIRLTSRKGGKDDLTVIDFVNQLKS